jgi:hypothetical protein
LPPFDALDKTPVRRLDVLAILPFGYPVEAAGRGKKQRKPLRDGSPPGTVRPALRVEQWVGQFALFGSLCCVPLFRQ